METEYIKAEIEKIDKGIASLFERRMELIKKDALLKKERGIPADGFECGETSGEEISSPDVKGYYESLLRKENFLAEKYQGYILNGIRVAFSGVEGAFANIAAKKIFPNSEAVPYGSFKAAYNAVAASECDVAVLPIENSFAGDVGQVMDIGNSGTLYINGIYELSIVQNLLAPKGVTIADVKRVISHPQALAQCEGYIEKHSFEKTECANTAAAAKLVAESNSGHLAAIASEETAELYGLSVLEKAINEDFNNTTRFAVFSRVPKNPSEAENHFIMFLTVKHETGSLSKVLEVFAQNGLNLQALKSRPTKEKGWEYYFYLEGEGEVSAEILAKLRVNCKNLKLAGNFKSVVSLKV